jgi:hypothetical protein
MDTDDITVLMIANEGERMIPIGRWQKPIERLLASGHLVKQPSAGDPTGGFNCVITALGRQAIAAEEKETDQQLGRFIEKSRTAYYDQTVARYLIEQAVLLIIDAATQSAPHTGDTVRGAAEKWLDLIENEIKQRLR